MLRKSALAICITAAVFGATNASAGAIEFSRDGTGAGTAVSIEKFNWQPDSLLAKNLIQTVISTVLGSQTASDTINPSFNFFGQGRLDSLVSDNNQNLGAPGCSLQGSTGSKCSFAGAFTYAFGVTLDVGTTSSSASATTVNAALGANPATNFFNIYFNADATAADSSTGLGYQPGTPILTAHFQNSSLSVTVDSQSSKGLFKLDSFGTDNRTNLGTLNMNGSFQMDIDVDTQNNSYFVTDLESIGLAMNLTSPNAAPFNQVNPAQSVVGNTPNLGVDQTTGEFVAGTTSTRTMNDLRCANPVNSATGIRNADANGTYTCDVQLQSQGTTAFFNVNTPEPGTTALLGLALSVLGVAQTRRSKKQA